MTLTQFRAALENDLEQFFAYYKDMHMKSPQDWPKAMKEGDWYEQFLMWNQTRK